MTGRYFELGAPHRWLSRVALVALAVWLGVAGVDPTSASADEDEGDVMIIEEEAIDDPAYSRAVKRAYSLFMASRWKAARKHYKKAYEIKPLPVLLFNIGSTLRREGNYLEALFYFHRYLKEAPKDAPMRSFAKNAITSLEAQLAEQEAQAKRKAKPDGAKNPEVSSSKPAEVRDSSSDNRGLQVIGVVVAIAGVGSVGFGGFKAREASDAASELENRSNGTPWSEAEQTIFDDGEAASNQAVIFAAAGGAAIVAGVVLYIVGQGSSSAEKPGTNVTWIPYTDNGSVGVLLRASF